MINKLDDYLRLQETTLSIRGQRQQLLASNVANADTPNYKARDIDFTAALQQAMGGSSMNPAVLKKTANHHLDAGTTVAGVNAQYRTNGQGNIDGNTVDMDTERNQFLDNAMRYEASLTIVSMQIKHMLAAIQGQ